MYCRFLVVRIECDEEKTCTGRIGMALGFLLILSLCPLVKSSSMPPQVFLWEQCYKYLDLDYLEHAVNQSSMKMVSKNGVFRERDDFFFWVI